MFGLFYMEPELMERLKDMNERMGRFLENCKEDAGAKTENIGSKN